MERYVNPLESKKTMILMVLNGKDHCFRQGFLVKTSGELLNYNGLFHVILFF